MYWQCETEKKNTHTIQSYGLCHFCFIWDEISFFLLCNQGISNVCVIRAYAFGCSKDTNSCVFLRCCYFKPNLSVFVVKLPLEIRVQWAWNSLNLVLIANLWKCCDIKWSSRFLLYHKNKLLRTNDCEPQKLNRMNSAVYKQNSCSTSISCSLTLSFSIAICLLWVCLSESNHVFVWITCHILY